MAGIDEEAVIRVIERHYWLRDAYAVAKVGQRAVDLAKLELDVGDGYIHGLSDEEADRYYELCDDAGGRALPTDKVYEQHAKFDKRVRKLAGSVGGYIMDFVGDDAEYPNLALVAGALDDKSQLNFDVQHRGEALHKVRHVRFQPDEELRVDGRRITSFKLKLPVGDNDVAIFNAMMGRLHTVHNQIDRQ